MNKKTISEIVDSLGVTKYTWFIYFLVGCALLFDGFDYMIVAYTMPQIAKEWALKPVQTGSLASWSILGLMIGGLMSGIISDRIGRRKTLAIFVAFYSLLTLPIYFVHSFEAFAILRILSGMGLGACIPIAVTMMSENSPTKNRGYFISSIMTFYVFGWVIAGIVAMYVVPTFGWRVCYLLGGLPALYSLVVFLKLPESPHWLLGKGRENEALDIIKRLEIAAKGVASEWAPGSLSVPAPFKKGSLGAIFSMEYLKTTIILSIIYFFGTMIMYGITGWLPTLLVQKGYSLIRGYSFAILQNVFGIFGGLCTGYVADIIGRRVNVFLGWIFTAVALVLLGYASNQWQVVIFSIVVGFAMNWSLSGVQPLLAEAYPTEFRNTGVAWAQAFGRVGGFLGPIAAGFVQQLGFGFSGTLIFFTIPAIIAGVTALILVEMKGKSIESIAGSMKG